MLRSYKNNLTRILFFLVGDMLALGAAIAASFLLLDYFGGSVHSFPWLDASLFICLSLLFLTLFNMYQVSWRFTSLRELLMIFLALTSAWVSYTALSFLSGGPGQFQLALSVLVLVKSIILVGGFRISKRMMHEVLNPPHTEKRAVIFGAGSAGEQILRDVKRHTQWKVKVKAIFDDHPANHGMTLHGVKILGGRRRMYPYLKYASIDELIIAIPSLPKKDLREVIERVKAAKPDIKVKVLPSFHKLSDDPVGVKNIREITIEDVLGREPARIDMKSIKSAISGKTVLVTGAGGSIGSEVVRQCANLGPARLIALDIDETELFHLLNEFDRLAANSGASTNGDAEDEISFGLNGNQNGHNNGSAGAASLVRPVPCVADITDRKRLARLFEKEKPDIVFHAAAYKHVPMMEQFPREAVRVNVGGTRLLAQLACEHGTDKFVLISTDKAVNPTNVMGATKRVAEEICLSWNELCLTQFISVRFGNVLGSRGSVVPLFIEQIKKGGPVTITDPEVKRYFMTIPEAVLLVMQAASMGEGGEVFVLDMGEPVRILDMARELIRLHGLEPDKDIAIEFKGLRPGEKMFEELLNAEEGVEETSHERIFKAICRKELSNKELNTIISQLFARIETEDEEGIRYLLRQIVPTYNYGSQAAPGGPAAPSETAKTGIPTGTGIPDPRKGQDDRKDRDVWKDQDDREDQEESLPVKSERMETPIHAPVHFAPER